MSKLVNPRKDVLKDWIRKFGLEEGEIKKVKDIEELKSSNLGIIVSEAVANFSYNLTSDETLMIKKGEKHLMSMSVFKQMWCDPKTTHQLLRPANVKFKNIYRPFRNQDLTNKSLLFMRHGGIGDLLFINPFVRFLKEKYPSCKISFCSGKKYMPMLENWMDIIDKTYTTPMKFKDFIMYDYHACFEGAIERNLEAEFVNVYELYNKYLEMDVPKEKLCPTQKPKEEMVEYCRGLLNQWGVKEKEFIIVQTTASSPIRTPSLEIWTKILNKFLHKGYTLVLSDSKHKADKVDKLISMLDVKDKVFNFARVSNAIDDGIAMTYLAKLLIGPDSSGTHIAASFNVPMVGIFGSFLGHVRLTTYYKADWVDAKKECAPCFRHGYMPCQYTTDGYHPQCFENINPDEVLEKAERLLND
jgi:ADP-heptose:LPS heptosyltransferase